MRDDGAIWAAGAMSGTSLDGVDAALLRTDGVQIYEFGPSAYRAYRREEYQSLRAALGKWPDDAGLEAAYRVIMEAHTELLNSLRPYELVGFHGQTLVHEPQGRGTHQLGDGGQLAQRLACPVVWDFRTTDIDWGGQGAPLAPFYHHACARYIGAKRPLAFLNLGGVGNLTYVDPRLERPEMAGALLAFDTGPANAPINDFIRAKRGESMDQDGQLAQQGRVADGALELFLEDVYFARIPPKSLDRDAFSQMFALVHELSEADAVATLTAMAASAVMLGVEHCPEPPERVLVTGGGRHNPVMMAMLRASLDMPVLPVEEVGLDGDMLEAQAFAYLAVRVARGLPTSASGTTGVRMAVGGGQLAPA